jgi:hypothetical protein
MKRRLSLCALALLASACGSESGNNSSNNSGPTQSTNGPSTANGTGSSTSGSNDGSGNNGSSTGTGGNGSSGSNNDGDPDGGDNGSTTGNTGDSTTGSSTGAGTGGSTGTTSSGENGPPLGSACGGKVKANVDGPLPTFEKHEISKVPGAAYMRPVDVDGDKFPEILLTNLSEGIDFAGGAVPLADGAAHFMKRMGGPPTDKTLGTWTATKVFDKSAKIGFPNESEFFDVDGDGVGDWMIGAGFLTKPVGKIIWMKGKGDGTFAAPVSVPVPDEKCWYHSTVPLDIDADGDNDFITSCHVGDTTNVNGPSQVEWFENDGKGTFTHHPIGAGGGAIISLYDIDEDGDKDVVAPQFFGPESMIWYEQTGAKGTAWAKHIINNTTGRGFIVRFADLNGDGRLDMVYGNHNNQQAAAPNNVMGVYWFEIPGKDVVRSLENWDAQLHIVYEGFMVPPDALMNNADSAGAPGMLNVGDIDGDCDMDITASGDGDQGLYVFVQQNGKFDRVTLFEDASNANSGEQHMIDLDGDGDLDIMWAVFGPAGAGSLFGLNSHVYGFLQN